MTASDLKALARALLRQLIGQLQARLLPWLRPHLRPRTLLLLPALFVLYVLVLIPFTPGIRDLRRAKVDQPAQVYSADGKLLAEFKPTHREWVSLKSVSPQVVDALIATEDRRFYTHHGIDFKRTASAALHTLKGDRQGGSTLTQQLARNLFPEEIGRSQTLTRKLKEAITAFKIEAVYSKDEILETYLNTVPFLYNAYGIEMAARTYFGKSAGELDALQSATLIGMLKGNSYYNPVINPERALDRRNIVLGQMVKFGHLPAAKLDALVKRPLRIDFERQTEEPGRAPHFAQQLRKWLIAWADDNDYNIYSDGLVVRTTIDSRLQTMATNALVLQGNQLQSIANAAWGTRGGCVKANADLAHAFMRETGEYRAARDGGMNDADALAKLGADRGFMQSLCEGKTRVQAGFVALDPRNGQIKAWVGSRDFAQDPFDHVAQGPPPARLDLQALRLRRGVRTRREADRHLRRSGRRDSDQQQRNLAPDRRCPAERQAGQPARRHRVFEEPHHRAADGIGRAGTRRPARARHGRARESSGRRAVACARHESGHAQGDGVGIRHDRQRWQLYRAAARLAHREQGRRGARAVRERARTRAVGRCDP